jgi:hypothetical protein
LSKKSEVNREIARLLSEAGVTDTVGWQDVVIRQNYAVTVAPPDGCLAASRSLGFNLSVLSRGSPAFVAKFRAVGEPELVRSTAIRNFVAGDRPDGLSVSPARIASSKRLTVQVSRYLPGSSLGEVVLRQSNASYMELLRTVLAGNAKLSRLAMSEPGLLKDRPATFSLGAIAAEVVADAADVAMLDAQEHAALASIVADAGEMPSRAQHGDFWWSNLLMIDGRVWVLDFDSYGEIRVPLFDDLTFMLGTLGLRLGSLAAGIERLGSDDAEARALRALLFERAEADGLAAGQIEAVIVYYLAHMTSEVHRRSGVVYVGPHADALRFAARQLIGGVRLHPAAP